MATYIHGLGRYPRVCVTVFSPGRTVRSVRGLGGGDDLCRSFTTREYVQYIPQNFNCGGHPKFVSTRHCDMSVLKASTTSGKSPGDG